jgi:hypothetical protein
MLRTLFGPRRGQVRGGWRGLHKEEFLNMYSSPSKGQVRGNEMDRACSTNVKKRNAYRQLVRKLQKKRERETTKKIKT